MAAAFAGAVLGAGKEALGIAKTIQGWIFKSKTRKAKDEAAKIVRGDVGALTKAQAKVLLGMRPNPIIPNGYTLNMAARHGLAGDYAKAEKILKDQEEDDVEEIQHRLKGQDREEIADKIGEMYDDMGWDGMVVLLRELVAEADEKDETQRAIRDGYRKQLDASSVENSRLLAQLGVFKQPSPRRSMPAQIPPIEYTN